jgi:multidrug transporter EmrE-like cation transporter
MNNFALARMQVTTMAAFSGLSTAVAIIEGVVWGGETLYMFHIIGMTLIFTRMVGMICLTAKSNGRWQIPTKTQ